jgi:hypothetical protein
MNKTEQAQQLRLAAGIIETGHPWEYSPDGFSWRLSEGKCPMYAVSQGWQIRLATWSPPPFKLPPPPPGMRWHREDGWNEGDLPQGYRPLVEGEWRKNEDEWTYDDGNGWRLVANYGPEGEVSRGAAKHRTTRPLVFTHEGKEWTWHRPGDPMPCDGEVFVDCFCKGGGTLLATRAKVWSWRGDIIGWRYAETTEQVELGPEDVPPGSVIRPQYWDGPPWIAVSKVCINDCLIEGKAYTWEMLKSWQINRSLPLTGKWDATAWEPCHKPKPLANG